MASIVLGMAPYEVQLAIGNPDETAQYPTGKLFIPLYMGNDKFRTEWRYRGAGRIIFSHPAAHYRGMVSRIDYNPQETGQLWKEARCGAPSPGTDVFGQVRPGMPDMTVRGLLGHPDHVEKRTNAKAWTPFYFGFDRVRATWIYDGIGIVTFYWGAIKNQMHVLKAERDPISPSGPTTPLED